MILNNLINELLSIIIHPIFPINISFSFTIYRQVTLFNIVEFLLIINVLVPIND